MDLETVFLVSGLIAAWAGTAAAVLHLYGYIPPRYRTQLAKIQATTAAAIGTELRAVFSEQEAKMAEIQEKVEDQTDPLLDALHELPLKFQEVFHAELQAQADAAKAEMAAAMKAQEEEAIKLGKSAEMSIVRGVGVDKQAASRVSRLLGEAILGPALPLLRQFAPGLADALEENPQLIDVVVRNPLFIKYVQPRIEQYLGSMGTGAGTPPAEAGGWGT